MFEKEVIPYAPVLVESMRSLGYSFESAVADLIDNSISANAKRIDIIMIPSDEPTLMIIDDGDGMSSKELQEAMRYGSQNPLEIRGENDLGRFGLGLKSASLSQCRELTVTSKKNGKLSGFAWKLDHIINTGEWSLIGFDEDEIQKISMIDNLNNKVSGTMVIWRNFDRVKASTHDITETLIKYMDNTIDHLALVFHRYLSHGVDIYVNNEKIEPRDPFLTNNKSTQYKREQSFYIEGSEITVKPFILPHISKLTKNDIKSVGGKDSLRTEQGFYIYRNKRLIIWGTWFRLERKDELSKLARVMVDIPNSLDYMWSIDIRKSSANLPDIIKKNLYNCVYETVLNSEKVHNYRGRRIKQKETIDYVWERIALREGYQYKINRDIPIMKLLKESLDDKQIYLVDELIKLVEESFPSNTLYLDVCKGQLSEAISEETQNIFNDIKLQLDVALERNMDVLSLIDAFINCEPYCLDKELVKLLEGEKQKYE